MYLFIPTCHNFEPHALKHIYDLEPLGRLKFQTIDSGQMADSEWVDAEINFDQDAWDDSTILSIFDAAIKSHRTKNTKGNVSRKSRGTKHRSLQLFIDADVVSNFSNCLRILTN